jgi:hypothetical protein
LSPSTTNLARKPEKRFAIWTRNRYFFELHLIGWNEVLIYDSEALS